jgi:hypothetical protein
MTGTNAKGSVPCPPRLMSLGNVQWNDRKPVSLSPYIGPRTGVCLGLGEISTKFALQSGIQFSGHQESDGNVWARKYRPACQCAQWSEVPYMEIMA